MRSKHYFFLEKIPSQFLKICTHSLNTTVGVLAWCPSRDCGRRSCSGLGPHPPPFKSDPPHHGAYLLVVVVSVLYRLIIVVASWGGGGINRMIGRILLLLLLLLFLLLWLKLGSGLCFGRVTGVKGKWEKRRWWGMGSAGNKTVLLKPSDRYGAHKQCEKYWVMTSEWWCQTGWGVLSDEWWVTEIEWGVTEIEWGVMSDEKKNPNKALVSNMWFHYLTYHTTHALNIPM